MAARAIWKGQVKVGSIELPVKLYSAVQDRTVHFRLLHKTDHAPVKQQLFDSETGKPVDFKETQKAFPLGRGKLVVLAEEEMEKVQPKESRDIEITRFVKPSDIDHRWYERAYYLGPDGNQAAYFAAAAALEKQKKEGIARWTMRKKSYVGALVAEDGYLMLITLRHAEEVISSESLEAPGGREVSQRELAMAEQLVKALEEKFDPSRFRDEYRARVMELVETKAEGGKVKVKMFRPRKTKDDSLADALKASLAGVGKKRAGGRG